MSVDSSNSLAPAEPSNVQPSREREQHDSVAAGSGWIASDSTAISRTASLVSATMSLPEVNSTRVSDLQLALAQGQFHVDTGSVATAVMRTMLDGAWS
jgi:flagellar biosynthesis anti-sigma factor FlgM